MSSPHDVIYRIEGRTLAHGLLVCALALALGYFTTGAYVAALGIDYLESGNQYLRHLAIIKGHGGDPWQYRMLAPYLLKSVIALNEWLAVSQPHARVHLLSPLAGRMRAGDGLRLLPTPGFVGARRAARHGPARVGHGPFEF